MSPTPLPERTVSGKPVKSLDLAPVPSLNDDSGPLCGAWRHSDGIVFCQSGRAYRFRQEDGMWQAAWPALDLPPVPGHWQLAGDTLFVSGGGELVALFAQTLVVRWRVALPDLVGEPIENTRVCLGPDGDRGVILALQGPTGGHLFRIPAEAAAPTDTGSVSRRRTAAFAGLCAVAATAKRVVLAGTETLYVLSWDTSEAAELPLGHAVGALWPSPDGAFLLAASDKGSRVSLIRLEPEALDATRILEGIFVPAQEGRAGGWLFWDQADPGVAGAKPLNNPAVSWTGDGRLAVLSTGEGEAVLIDAREPRTVKLMVPPGEPLWPLALDPPDSLLALGRMSVNRFVLDWRFGEANPAKPDPDKGPSPDGADSETSRGLAASPGPQPTRRAPAPAWLIPAALAAAALAYALARWIG